MFEIEFRFQNWSKVLCLGISGTKDDWPVRVPHTLYQQEKQAFVKENEKKLSV